MKQEGTAVSNCQLLYKRSFFEASPILNWSQFRPERGEISRERLWAKLVEQRNPMRKGTRDALGNIVKSGRKHFKEKWCGGDLKQSSVPIPIMKLIVF